MPLKLSHKPPEARIWLATIILAPAVPRKVIVSLDGLLSSIADVTIERGCTFYNLACCEMLFSTTMVPFLVLGCCHIPHIY